VLVNVWREGREEPLPPLSLTTVKRFQFKSDWIKIQHRKTCKSGKTDQDSTWAKASKAEAEQLLKQIEMGEMDPESGEYKTLREKMPPIYINALAFWDEHHREIILGHASKMEGRVARNPFDGEFTSPDMGGVFGKERPNTSVKYPGQACGSFGVCLDDSSGELEGIRLTPFDYTGKKVVGDKAYSLAMDIELNRVKKLKGQWGAPGAGYYERWSASKFESVPYPGFDEPIPRAEAELRAIVDRKLCHVNRLIDHCFTETEKQYKGTKYEDSWMLYHDGLTQWWTPEGQAYIRSKGWYDRQVMCRDPTNMDNRYRNKTVGDRPEFCRGLDAYGFSDLKAMTVYMRSLTSMYTDNDKEKFKFGTPAEAMHTVLRCWEYAPSSSRIIQDILDLPTVLRKVIEVNGTVLPECKLRHGHRALRHDKKGALKCKLKTSQRIETNIEKPIHPHAQRGRSLILGYTPALLAQLPDIDSDASTESEGEGGNTDDDLSELGELDLGELAGEDA